MPEENLAIAEYIAVLKSKIPPMEHGALESRLEGLLNDSSATEEEVIAILREIIDARFKDAGGWTQRRSGGVDWIKKQAVNGRPRYICVGVEIQVSGRNDMLSVDLIHLKKELLQGMIDLAVLVVPSDRLGLFLTDRVARLSEAKRHIDMARAEEMPFILMAIEHDGPGPALKKQPRKSNQPPA